VDAVKYVIDSLRAAWKIDKGGSCSHAQHVRFALRLLFHERFRSPHKRGDETSVYFTDVRQRFESRFFQRAGRCRRIRRRNIASRLQTLQMVRESRLCRVEGVLKVAQRY